MALSLAGLLAACQREEAGKAVEASALDAASAKRSLEGLKPRLRALNKKFAALHKQFDPLPLNLPGFDDIRGRFYSTDEGLGIMGPKVDWLSSRLDAALRSGNREQLQQVSKDIAETYDEMRLIDQIARELGEQVVPFQRMVAELEAEQNRAVSTDATQD